MATSKKSAGSAKSTAKKGAAKKGAAKSGAKSAGKSAGKAAAKGGARSAGGATKAAAKPASGGRSGGQGAGKSAAKKSGGRAPNPAFMKPMQPSEELAQVVGAQPQPRSEITKRVWDYIKKNNLQDQQNKRNINADDRLRPVFGGKRQVTMFEMTKLVNDHLSDA